MRRGGNGKQPEEQHLHKQQHQEAERHHVEMAVVGGDDVEVEDGGVVKEAVYPRPTRAERDFFVYRGISNNLFAQGVALGIKVKLISADNHHAAQYQIDEIVLKVHVCVPRGLSTFNSFRVFLSSKQHLPRWKSSQDVQPCCGFRLESSAL